jgi:hypothetical protein
VFRLERADPTGRGDEGLRIEEPPPPCAGEASLDRVDRLEDDGDDDEGDDISFDSDVRPSSLIGGVLGFFDARFSFQIGLLWGLVREGDDDEDMAEGTATSKPSGILGAATVGMVDASSDDDDSSDEDACCVGGVDGTLQSRRLIR